MRKCLLVLLPFFVAYISNAQNDVAFMKWKLQPGETLTYKVFMNETDTAAHKDISFRGLYSLLDTDKAKDREIDAFFTALSESVSESDLVCHMRENKKRMIDIEMTTEEKKKGKDIKQDSLVKEMADKFKEFAKEMNDGVQLRGTISPEGNIESYYVQNNQRNLLSLFFELPCKPVRVNDSWPLDVHLISMDQNFKCDTSYRKNKVTLNSIKKKGDETIAIIKYDVCEYVSGDFHSPFGNDKNEKTMMYIAFQGLAAFSIEKGRWVSYDGFMSLKGSGVMQCNVTKEFKMVAQ